MNYYVTKHFNQNQALIELIEKLSKNITAIYKCSDGMLLLGTWDKGLFIIDKNNKRVDIDLISGHFQINAEQDHKNNFQ